MRVKFFWMILPLLPPISPQTILLYASREARRASASLGRGHVTWSTQTRQWSSLASLSKYSNDHYEKAIPFWIQQYSSASEGSHRSLFLSCSMWAALVKAENPGWEGIKSLALPTCHLSTSRPNAYIVNNVTENLTARTALGGSWAAEDNWTQQRRDSSEKEHI